MNIDPNNASQIQAKIIAARQNATISGSQTSKPQSASVPQNVEFNILDKLRSEPEVRPEVVAKGKELLNDPSFPSPEVVNSIAKLITPYADDE